MKKILLYAFFMITSISLLFSGGLITDLNSLENLVNEKNPLWTAKIPESFLSYDSLGIKSISELLKKIAGNIQLPYIRDDFSEAGGKINDRLSTIESVIYSTEFFWLWTLNHSIPELPEYFPSSYLSPHSAVKNQGLHGTCWAFSSTGAVESALLVQKDKVQGYPESSINPEAFKYSAGESYSSDIYDLSEQFASFHNIDWGTYMLFWQGDNPNPEAVIQDSNNDSGGNNFFAFYNAVRYGIPLESDFPYLANDLSGYIKWNPKNPNWEENLTKSSRTLEIPGAPSLSQNGISYYEYLNTVKSAITLYGSMNVSIEMPVDLSIFSEGVYYPVSEEISGSHSMLLIGWVSGNFLRRAGILDSDFLSYYDPFLKEAFSTDLFWIIKNSWGKDWGKSGYVIFPAISSWQYFDKKFSPWMIETECLRTPVLYPAVKENDWVEGDFNKDGFIDERDFNLLKTAMGSYDPIFDISNIKDGKIDFEDFSKFLIFWNSKNK